MHQYLCSSIRRTGSLPYFCIGFLFTCYMFLHFDVNPFRGFTPLRPCRPEEGQVLVIGQPPDTVSVPVNLLMTGDPIVLEQDDPSIIKYIRDNKYLESPPEESSSYNLAQPGEDPSRGQGQFIRKILANMTNGFFVECGALDGETRSNTLFMEQHLNWTGLLVEGDPSNYEKMKTKNRRAWLSKSCLSIKSYPHQVIFLQKFNQGKILSAEDRIELNEKDRKRKKVKVQCFPLFSLLTAMGVNTVDYFSLDVEGSELKVLKTIPFDKVLIRTLSVEYIHTGEGKGEILSFMKSKGFRKVGEVHYPNNLANDIIFVHNSVNYESTIHVNN